MALDVSLAPQGSIRVKSKDVSHGLSGHPLYSIFHAMHRRCKKENKNCAHSYFERGIFVCERWSLPNGVGLENFIMDMGKRPSGYTLERINNDLGYSPENCRWDTREKQGYNQRKPASNTSGKTGVSPKKNGKFLAYIGVDGKKLYLGTFPSLEAAVSARAAAELLYYGFIKE